MVVRPATSCVWHPCEELGTWEHVAWLCPCRAAGSYCPRPRLALSARWGWVVKGQQVDYIALHRWLILQSKKSSGQLFIPCELFAASLGSWLGRLLASCLVASLVWLRWLLVGRACALPVSGYWHLQSSVIGQVMTGVFCNSDARIWIVCLSAFCFGLVLPGEPIESLDNSAFFP